MHLYPKVNLIIIVLVICDKKVSDSRSAIGLVLSRSLILWVKSICPEIYLEFVDVFIIESGGEKRGAESL